MHTGCNRQAVVCCCQGHHSKEGPVCLEVEQVSRMAEFEEIAKSNCAVTMTQSLTILTGK